MFIEFLSKLYMLLFFVLSGVAEPNSGSRRQPAKSCRILSANVLGLHKNLMDHTKDVTNHDLIFCSETLVSDLKNVSELRISNFREPVLIRRDYVSRASGMSL